MRLVLWLRRETRFPEAPPRLYKIKEWCGPILIYEIRSCRKFDQRVRVSGYRRRLSRDDS